MLRIAFRTLAGRKAGMLGAFTAVTLAVVLVVSCGILLDSSLRAPSSLERLAGADVIVQADPALGGDGNVDVSLSERSRVPAALARRVAGVQGVRSAIADRSFFVQIADARGHVLEGRHDAPTTGHAWNTAPLTPIVLASGHAPRTDTDVVLAADAAARGNVSLGATVHVRSSTAGGSFTVVGTATPAPGHRLTREAPVFFRHDVATRLSGDDRRADLIALLLAPGADARQVAARVRATLAGSDVRVLTGAARGDAETPDDALARDDTVAGLTVFAALAAFVAIFVVAGTFALSVQQRHRELALFRAIGATPRQVRRMVAGEALLVALAAVAIAAAISVPASRVEQHVFSRVGIVSETLPVTIGWLPFVAGLVTAIVTTQLAAFASARRASRIRPTDALRESSARRGVVTPLRLVLGLAAIAGGAAILARAGSGSESIAPAAAMVWMLAAALLGPLLAWPFSRLLGPPLTVFGNGPGLLARANTRAELRRVASVATPLTLAVALVATIFYGKSLIEQQTENQTAERTTAGYVLSARDGRGLPDATAAQVRQLNGVVQASGSFATTVLVAEDGVNERSFPAQGVDAATLAGVLDLDVAAGSLAQLRGAALAVSTDSAKSFGWHVGERARLRLGDGTRVSLRVAATFRRPLGFGNVLLPRALAARHVTEPLDDLIYVSGTRGALDALNRVDPGVRVQTRAQYREAVANDLHEQAAAVYVLLGLIVAFCALAVVNAVMMSTSERAREFALLRLVGASRRQIRAMIRGETLIVIAFGLTLGTAIAAPAVATLSHDLAGSPVPPGPWWVYGALVAFYAVIALAAAGASVRLALRMHPVRAMAARE
jgi:putative ABC transport system permease protein